MKKKRRNKKTKGPAEVSLSDDMKATCRAVRK
jgi:hypothetical protein